MTAPLPYPKHTDLLGDTDLAIRRLAEAVDGKLGTAYKYVTAAQTCQVDGSGNIAVTFPLSTTVIGAIVIARAVRQVKGPVASLPPVPPSSVSRLLPYTPYMIFPWGYGVGLVNCFTRTFASTLQPAAGTPTVVPFYGSQQVASSYALDVIGIAWGAA